MSIQELRLEALKTAMTLSPGRNVTETLNNAEVVFAWLTGPTRNSESLEQPSGTRHMCREATSG